MPVQQTPLRDRSKFSPDATAFEAGISAFALSESLAVPSCSTYHKASSACKSLQLIRAAKRRLRSMDIIH